MKWIKLGIVVAISAFTAYLCLWPVAGELSWFARLADPMVQPMLTIMGIFAIIVLVTSVLSQL